MAETTFIFNGLHAFGRFETRAHAATVSTVSRVSVSASVIKNGVPGGREAGPRKDTLKAGGNSRPVIYQQFRRVRGVNIF